MFKTSMLCDNWITCVPSIFINYESRTWPIPKSEAACISGRKYGLKSNSRLHMGISYLNFHGSQTGNSVQIKTNISTLIRRLKIITLYSARRIDRMSFRQACEQMVLLYAECSPAILRRSFVNSNFRKLMELAALKGFQRPICHCLMVISYIKHAVFYASYKYHCKYSISGQSI